MGRVMNVKIETVVEALEYPEDWECYLDRATGQLVVITENEEPYLDRDGEVALDEIDDLPQWQRDSIANVRLALESADLVPVPSKFDLHEWEIMRSFSNSCPEPIRRDLLDAIHGRGAFRTFRRTVDRLGVREDWFAYRDETVRRFAEDWLLENGFEVTEQ